MNALNVYGGSVELFL